MNHLTDFERWVKTTQLSVTLYHMFPIIVVILMHHGSDHIYIKKSVYTF